MTNNSVPTKRGKIRHQHKWQFVSEWVAHLTPIIDTAPKYELATYKFVCDCGKVKQVKYKP